MGPSKPLYHRRRFPAEIISHCVWSHFRFCLSYRDVEEIMAERGVVVTYETIRDWSQKVSRNLRQAAAVAEAPVFLDSLGRELAGKVFLMPLVRRHQNTSSNVVHLAFRVLCLLRKDCLLQLGFASGPILFEQQALDQSSFRS